MTYDFRERFQLSLTEVGRTLTYGEAILLAGQLMKDQSSHLYASMSGWEHPLSRLELMMQVVAERVLAVTRDEKKQPKPTTFGWPWEKPVAKFAEVSDQERRQYTEQLRSRSAFAQLRG